MKSQLLVWGATQMMHLSWCGTVTCSFQPRSLNKMKRLIGCDMKAVELIFLQTLKVYAVRVLVKRFGSINF